MKRKNISNAGSKLSRPRRAAPLSRGAKSKPGSQAPNLAAIIAHAPVILFALDAQGRCTLCEGQGLIALGLKAGQAVGRSALEMYRDIPALTADVKRALAGESFSSVAKVGRVWFETHYRPFFDLTGRLLGVIGLSCDVTERKRMEEDLNRSERRFRHLIDSMHEGFYLADREGKRLFVNRALLRIYGCSDESELLDKSVFDRVEPGVRENIQERFQEAMRTGVFPESVQVPFIRQDGSQGTLELNPSPVYEDGKLVGASGVVRDITERKQDEAELVSSRQMLQLVLDNIPQRVFWKDRNSRYIGANQPFLRDAGLKDLSELRGKNDFDLSWKETAPLYQADDKSVMSSGKPKLGYEEPQSKPDGGKMWLRTNKIPLKDAQGRIIGVLGAYEDITEQRQNEDALRLSQFSMDHCPIPVHWVDEKARLLYVNDAACAAMGYERSEMMKLSIGDIDCNWTPEWWRNFWKNLRQQKTVFLETLETAKDGRKFPVELAANYMNYQGHEYCFAFVRDISERARLLKFEQAARAEAEAASRAKDEFLAIVSHELRTPMTAILGWNWLLRSGELSPMERDRALDVIERNMQLQKQIIEDLLDVSSLARRQLTIKKQFVELSSVIQDAAARVHESAENKSLKISLETAANLMVEGDPERLRQIFWNLLTNAVKFTPEAGLINVRMRAERSEALVTVEDTGPGLSPEFFPHLFELFRQQEDSLTREHRGLGLGLSIVKRLVELHGGRIWADPPQAGPGARFTVALPLAAPRPGTSAATPDGAQSEASSQFMGALKGVKILVVEDDDDTRQMLTSVLSHCGAVIEEAVNAADGFSRFARNRPDVIVSDIAMPGEDGYSFIRRIRALKPEQGGEVAAAALTAYATAEDRTMALKAGFQIYLPKPVDPTELVAVVRALSQRRAGTAQP
ncbi:MAG TPA: hypothetical protein DEB40_04180 [Elusimicrobia bacterium]|nr:hypothetical protein [Elusimicrobiota bacterium]HBT60923.1 hypothetical protein [Elusimicrobiota bacterium]